MSFCSLINGTTPKICRLCFCPNEQRSFEPFICLDFIPSVLLSAFWLRYSQSSSVVQAKAIEFGTAVSKMRFVKVNSSTPAVSNKESLCNSRTPVSGRRAAAKQFWQISVSRLRLLLLLLLFLFFFFFSVFPLFLSFFLLFYFSFFNVVPPRPLLSLSVSLPLSVSVSPSLSVCLSLTLSHICW